MDAVDVPREHQERLHGSAVRLRDGDAQPSGRDMPRPPRQRSGLRHELLEPSAASRRGREMRQHVASRAELAIDHLAKVSESIRGSHPYVLHVRSSRGGHRAQTRGLRHARAQQAEHQDAGIQAVLALRRLHELNARLGAKHKVPRERQNAAELGAHATGEAATLVAVRDVHNEARTIVQRAGGVGAAQPQEHPVGGFPSALGILAHRQQKLVRATDARLLLAAELHPAKHAIADLVSGQWPADELTKLVRADVEMQLQHPAHLLQRAQEELKDALVHAAATAQHGLAGNVDAPAFAGQLDADAVGVASRALALLVVERGIQPLRDQALQRLPYRGQV